MIEYLEAAHPDLVGEMDQGVRGLTAVVGRCAVQVLSSNDVVRGGRWDYQRLADSIRDAPQARRPISELAVTVLVNHHEAIKRLVPEEVEPDPDWPELEVSAPSGVVRDSRFVTGATAIGTLRLSKAGVPLTGRLKYRNAVSVTDGTGNPIASYQLLELPIAGSSPHLAFLHGDLELTFPGLDGLVANDREKLVRSATTESILEWTAERVWERTQEIARAAQESARKSDLEVASILNDALNEHTKKFLEELQTQIYVDLVQTPEGGGPGPVHGPGKRTTPGGVGTGGPGKGGIEEVPGTTERVRRPRFAQILLSGFDPDPATGGADTKRLTDRHPPLEQDDVDKRHNVWWINTQHPFAQEALKRGGPQGSAFRSYQLHMFRDVVQREALRFRQRRESELGLDLVENELTEASNRFLANLPYDLLAKLLD